MLQIVNYDFSHEAHFEEESFEKENLSHKRSESLISINILTNHGRPKDPPPFSRRSYVRNNAIADGHCSRGSQTLQHPKQEQGNIMDLKCKPNIRSNINTERDYVHRTTANFVREFSKECGCDALKDEICCDGEIDQLQASVHVPLEQRNARKVDVGAERREHHGHANEEGDPSSL